MHDTFELPPEQTGPAAWRGPAMAARDDWIEHLAPAEVAEIEAAAAPIAPRTSEIAALRAADLRCRHSGRGSRACAMKS